MKIEAQEERAHFYKFHFAKIVKLSAIVYV